MTTTNQHIWVGPGGNRYSRNPLCQSVPPDCPGVCAYCLEYGVMDESAEVGAQEEDFNER